MSGEAAVPSTTKPLTSASSRTLRPLGHDPAANGAKSECTEHEPISAPTDMEHSRGNEWKSDTEVEEHARGGRHEQDAANRWLTPGVEQSLADLTRLALRGQA